MNYTLVSENALRQQIDSTTVFQEYRRTAEKASRYRGGMYWKKQGSYEYLVKTTPDGRQKRIGPRSSDTEAAYAAFTGNKTELENRLASLHKAVREAERLNKALRVGRAPNILVDILGLFEETRLANHFTVVGTHALYAYETAAGVRVSPGSLATKDVDMLWDARRYLRFLADMKELDTSMLALLQKVDASFRRKDDALCSAMNNEGFEVEFLRREQEGDDPHPFRFSDDEQDLWPVQARRASVLTQAPPFEQVIISTTGRMALMRTIDPVVFVQFKGWMASVPDRDPIKKRRDALQAATVQQLLDEQLLIVR